MKKEVQAIEASCQEWRQKLITYLECNLGYPVDKTRKPIEQMSPIEIVNLLHLKDGGLLCHCVRVVCKIYGCLSKESQNFLKQQEMFSLACDMAEKVLNGYFDKTLSASQKNLIETSSVAFASKTYREKIIFVFNHENFHTLEVFIKSDEDLPSMEIPMLGEREVFYTVKFVKRVSDIPDWDNLYDLPLYVFD